jgi:RNA polymerase sigma-70 factor (ECF subfamily)
VGYLLTLGASLHAAEDATQEAMHYAFRRWAEIQRNPGSWVRTVARQVFIRSHKRDEERLAREIRSGTPPEFLPDPAEHAGELGWATEMINKLSPAQRDVMLLSVFGELSPTEIAEQLGKRADTVRSNLVHARRNLAQLLGIPASVAHIHDEPRED